LPYAKAGLFNNKLQQSIQSSETMAYQKILAVSWLQKKRQEGGNWKNFVRKTAVVRQG